MPMKPEACAPESPPPLSPLVREAAERVSFCMDAPELLADDGAELDALLADTVHWSHTRQTWGDGHWLGEVLRHGEGALPPADAAFVVAVMQRVAQEPLPQVVPLPSAHPTASQTAPQTATVVPLPVAEPRVAASEAANDAVFRWKWVAGVAAMAAVVSVAWQVVVAPSGRAAGPQLAQAPTQAVPAAPVQVWTEHGLVLRDPQLQAWLSTHRQLDATLALQGPAGFVRSATYNHTPQR